MTRDEKYIPYGAFKDAVEKLSALESEMMSLGYAPDSTETKTVSKALDCLRKLQKSMAQKRIENRLEKE